MLVRGEPVDQIALRDHVLVLQRQGAELSEANPLADRVAVVAGEIHDGGHVDHVRVGGELAFIVTPSLLRIARERAAECGSCRASRPRFRICTSRLVRCTGWG